MYRRKLYTDIFALFPAQYKAESLRPGSQMKAGRTVLFFPVAAFLSFFRYENWNLLKLAITKLYFMRILIAIFVRLQSLPDLSQNPLRAVLFLETPRYAIEIEICSFVFFMAR